MPRPTKVETVAVERGEAVRALAVNGRIRPRQSVDVQSPVSGTLLELPYDVGDRVAAGTPIEVPHEYYPDDDPRRPPLNRWRSHAHLLFGNWINEIYQTTHYDLERIGTE